MKKSIIYCLKSISFLSIIFLTAYSCTSELDPLFEDETADPIVGKWFLKKVNSTDVTDIECYNTSFIESDANQITFFIQDRLENGDCETVLTSTQELTIQDDFYYLGDEALDLNIDGRMLTWRVDLETTLEFEK